MLHIRSSVGRDQRTDKVPVFKEVSIIEKGLHVDSYKGRCVSHLLERETEVRL